METERSDPPEKATLEDEEKEQQNIPDEEDEQIYDEREAEHPDIHSGSRFMEDEYSYMYPPDPHGYPDQGRFQHLPPGHWGRFGRSPPVHGRASGRSHDHPQSCRYCNRNHFSPEEHHEDTMQGLTDYELDHIDEAPYREDGELDEVIGNVPKSSFLNFNFSYTKVITVSLLLVMAQHLSRVVYMFGLHRTVFSHSPGPCHLLEGVVGGSEDIVTLRDGLSFISSGYASYTTDRGRIYTYQHGEAQNPREVKFTETFDKHRFYPHGIGAWQHPESGEITLFCINHHPLGDRIEKFRYDQQVNSLEHLATILDQTIKYANDVVPINEDRFYFTNSAYSTNQHMLMFEVFLMLSWGTVVYYDGEKGHVVDRGLVPNGIALSPNKQYMYVSNTAGQEIRVFRRNDHDGSIDFVHSYPVDASVDNLSVDEESGDLWVGAQNAMAEFIPHDKNPVMPCGSRVFRIRAELDGSRLTQLTEVYASDGLDGGLSCSSVGSFYNGSVLIGALRSPPLLCTVLI